MTKRGERYPELVSHLMRLLRPRRTRVSWRRRCNAHCKQPPLRYCRNWAVPGRNRCRFHGGMSTGPKTPEGKARVVAAMVAGRHRWVERMKAEGRKFPCGRKPGYRPKLQTTGVLPRKDYRRMTLQELRAAALESIAILQERLRRTGRLSG